MDCLYISHTGMTEPLGRSQVLPYLFGLSRKGFEIEILSHEPAGTAPEAIARTRGIIEGEGVRWMPLVRSKSHHLGVKVWESGRAVMRGLAEALRRRPRIVHARSYLPAAVADVVATLSPGAKMIFDCRGMLGDEYVDAGWWTKDRLEYKLLKRFEGRLFTRAEGIVVLTDALRRWLLEERVVRVDTPIQVVPCCVDADRFVADPDARAHARKELGVGDDLVLLYSGSLGSWYQADEMARLAAKLQSIEPKFTWVVLTHTKPEEVEQRARAHGIQRLVVRSATPDEMPRLLPAGDVGVSFIRPCFSKQGSSPTKVAEYLAAGMPLVMNAGIGDIADLAVEHEACVVIPSYDDAVLERAARSALELARRPYEARAAATRQVARARYGMRELGVPRYEELYRRLLEAA